MYEGVPVAVRKRMEHSRRPPEKAEFLCLFVNRTTGFSALARNAIGKFTRRVPWARIALWAFGGLELLLLQYWL